MQQITEKDLSKIAKKISNKVKKGDYIFLEGELGVGKTTFAKYFINHFNQKFKKKIVEVLSPTFNIVQYYDVNKKISIAHYDLYKLKSKKDLENIGIFDFEDQFKIGGYYANVEMKPQKVMKFLEKFKLEFTQLAMIYIEKIKQLSN